MTIYVNEREVVFEKYPNGEAIVPALSELRVNSVNVRLHWSGDEDLLRLAFVRGLISQDPRFTYTVLTIDYMPYSRMDRVQDGHCFSLKYVTELINDMCWNKIYVVEPHSDATIDLLLHAEPIWATARLTPLAMRWVNFDHRLDYIVLPDAGAYKRYSALVPELSECHVIVMKKRRDFATGKIEGVEVDHRIVRGSNDPGPASKALIIDDLSSRGGTFVQVAMHLRYLDYCERVSLLVTHMEPVGLTGDLSKTLDRVFFTDTMTVPRPLPANFEVFQRRDWL